jgi:hypothetical protein
MTRTLIYAMQSSGASYYAFCLGQAQADKKVLCIPDLWHPFLAPSFEGVECDEIILKVVVTNNHTLEQHQFSFQPTRTILFYRDPLDNYKSLEKKSYANEGGNMDFKFSLHRLEDDSCENWSEYVDYKDIPKLTTFAISPEQMRANNAMLSDWAAANYGIQWGFGGLRV